MRAPAPQLAPASRTREGLRAPLDLRGGGFSSGSEVAYGSAQSSEIVHHA